MLSPDAKRVLKHAKANNNKANFRDIEKRFNWQFEKAKSACQQLVEERFADWVYDNPVPGTEFLKGPLAGKKILSGILLNENGQYKKRLSFYNAVGFIAKNVILPIGVSAVTAYITTLITLAMQAS